jgi:hypothetical protein
MATSTLSDKPVSIGTQAAQPASGSVILTANEVNYPFFKMKFTLNAARISVTDGAASGSFGALKLFDFNEQAIVVLGARQNYTAFAEGSALTGGAGDAVFDIGVGSVAKAAAADGALGGATDDDIAGEIAITLSGGTGTGTLVSASNLALNGTGTAADVVLNVSGTAATIDATSTLDVTGDITIFGVMLDDD